MWWGSPGCGSNLDSSRTSLSMRWQGMDGQRRAQLVERQSAQLYDGHRRGPRWDRRRGRQLASWRTGKRWTISRASMQTARTSLRHSSTQRLSPRWLRFRAASTATCPRVPSAGRLFRGRYRRVAAVQRARTSRACGSSSAVNCSMLSTRSISRAKYQRQRNHVRPHYHADGDRDESGRSR